MMQILKLFQESNSSSFALKLSCLKHFWRTEDNVNSISTELHNNTFLTVKHSGGVVMVWGCVTDLTMMENEALFHNAVF